MKERIFGSESEYALYFHHESGRTASSMGGEKLLEFFKELTGLLSSSLERKGCPRAGEFLGNGGRFYIDRGGHPEYATPECRRVRDLVAHEKAGDLLVRELTAAAREQLQSADDKVRRLRIYKNNVDGFGNTYGGHENYLIAAGGMKNIRAIIAFLATRQIYTGAGKATGKLPSKGVPFQISQRAEFFNRVFSDRTSDTRGIINTRRREIPRLDEDRRLHIICGDCNMSEYAVALKFGVASVLLRMLEDGALENSPTLLYPVEAMKRVSKNPNASLELGEKPGKASALEIQEVYFEKAADYFSENEISGEEQAIMDLWRDTLDDLCELEFFPETGELGYTPENLVRRLDWVTKLWLIGRHREKGGLSWDDRALAALDFQYHDLDPATGLYEKCAKLGMVDRWIDPAAAEAALTDPPQGTRAAFRGRVIKETFGKNVNVRIDNWEKISIAAKNREQGPVHPFVRNKRIMNALEISLKDPFLDDDPESMKKLAQFLETWG